MPASAESFSANLRFAVGYYWLVLLLLQTVVFLDLRRRGRDDELLHSMAVRDHLVRAMVRGAILGSGTVVVGFAAWVFSRGTLFSGAALITAELLVAFTLVAMGFAAATARFSFRLIERQGPAGVPLVRFAFLLLGAGYGLALWLLLPTEAMETVISVLILGAALVGLGLNRTEAVSPETLGKMARGE